MLTDVNAVIANSAIFFIILNFEQIYGESDISKNKINYVCYK
ncbi:hypothetical protein NU08_1745 [Flavobacterium anhuiense]|uniref:Uncharacterized protein n=1 Tax=Flavobacterium anhuiense TaxID=459526 RepID=A0A444W0N8_9FLAO|nr:hypothetical protein NU08_1745 [Flavobacterium anhuiense]